MKVIVVCLLALFVTEAFASFNLEEGSGDILAELQSMTGLTHRKSADAPITQIAVTYSDVETDEEELLANQFIKIPENINKGSGSQREVFLWVKRGVGLPITAIGILFDTKEIPVDWHRLERTYSGKEAADLNGGAGGRAVWMIFKKTDLLGGGNGLPVTHLKIIETGPGKDKGCEHPWTTIWNEYEGHFRANLNANTEGDPLFLCYQQAPIRYADKRGNGNGVIGEYFKNTLLDGNGALMRVDPNINFDWSGGIAPMDDIPTDHYSIRWTGLVEAPVSNLYTFHTTTSDGSRLWIDGLLIIDDWTKHKPKEMSSTQIFLQGGDKYEFRMEYFAERGGGVAEIRWEGRNVPKEIIPIDRFYSNETLIPEPENETTIYMRALKQNLKAVERNMGGTSVTIYAPQTTSAEDIKQIGSSVLNLVGNYKGGKCFCLFSPADTASPIQCRCRPAEPSNVQNYEKETGKEEIAYQERLEREEEEAKAEEMAKKKAAHKKMLEDWVRHELEVKHHAEAEKAVVEEHIVKREAEEKARKEAEIMRIQLHEHTDFRVNHRKDVRSDMVQARINFEQELQAREAALTANGTAEAEAELEAEQRAAELALEAKKNATAGHHHEENPLEPPPILSLDSPSYRLFYGDKIDDTSMSRYFPHCHSKMRAYCIENKLDCDGHTDEVNKNLEESQMAVAMNREESVNWGCPPTTAVTFVVDEGADLKNGMWEKYYPHCQQKMRVLCNNIERGWHCYGGSDLARLDSMSAQDTIARDNRESFNEGCPTARAYRFHLQLH